MSLFPSQEDFILDLVGAGILTSSGQGGYLVTLAEALSSGSVVSYLRKAAGLALKNALTARETVRAGEYAKRWTEVPQETRTKVKHETFSVLSQPDHSVSVAAAQVCAAIEAIELPLGQTDLLEMILSAVSTYDNKNLQKASLDAIGFICEASAEVRDKARVRKRAHSLAEHLPWPQQSSNALAAKSNEILTAVIQGARKEETSTEVQLAALGALFNSLEFVRVNFERDGERNYIMQVVCEATQSPNIDIKVAAYECLVRIMQLYYDKMKFYMEQALFGVCIFSVPHLSTSFSPRADQLPSSQLTVLGMRDSESKVALQAIEFWSTVCEEEIDLTLEAQEAAEYGEEPSRPCYNFARVAAGEIVPVLMELLKTQDEDADEDEWDVSKAAGVCTGLLAQSVGDDIVPLAIPFIETNIKSPDWHARDAAVLCFGQILDGPMTKTLTPLVEQALPTIIGMMTDQSPAVKDSVAWTLGRITDLLCDVIHPDVHLPELVRAAIVGLQDKPHIAMLSGWTLMNLTEQLGGLSVPDDDGNPGPTSIVSRFFADIVNSLVAATDRPNNEQNARTSAYEALASSMAGCAGDCLPNASSVLVTMLDRQERLNGMANQLVGMDDRNNWSELQTNLCSVIQAIVRRLGKEILPLSDRIMTSLLTTIQNCGKQSEALEDAFMAVGSVTAASEAEFEKYLQAFSPFLVEALRKHEETQLCKTAVGLVGDICRALGPNAANYANDFMVVLFEDLQSQTLSREVKPTILSSFGDIALAIGDKFEPFLATTMAVLQQAAASSVTNGPLDYEIIEFFNSLREGIAEAYVGIVSGLRGAAPPAGAAGPSSNGAPGSGVSLLQPHVEAITSFLQIVASSQAETSEPLLRSSVGLLGDICDAFPNGELKPLLQRPWVADLIKAARARGNGADTRKTATWTREMVKKAGGGSS